MPIEIFDKDKFIEIAEEASDCIIKRNPDNTKLKVKTSRYLYTIKLDPEDVDEVLSKINCPTIEIE